MKSPFRMGMFILVIVIFLSGVGGSEFQMATVSCLTCLMAVTVMTKNNGRPLVTGLVGVSTITCRREHQKLYGPYNPDHKVL